MYLMDAVGVQIEANDDKDTSYGGGGSTHSYDSYIEYTAASSGVYYAKLESYDHGSSGDYELNVSIQPTADSIGLGIGASNADLQAATDEYNAAVNYNTLAENALAAAQTAAHSASSMLSVKATAKAYAQNTEGETYTSWQDAVDFAAQKLSMTSYLQPLQYQTDRLIIPQTFALIAATLNVLTGDLTFSYTSLDGTGLLAEQHTVTVADHNTDPIDLITVDTSGDGYLSTFVVAQAYVADMIKNTLIVGSNTSEGEALVGGVGDDLIFANAGNDMVAGGAGHDTLRGGDGNDTISGGSGVEPTMPGSGDDVIYGGAGDDTISGGDGDDTIEGGEGDDTIDGGDGDDTVRYLSGADTIDGGADTDLISFNMVTESGVVLDLSQNYADVGTTRSTLSNFENIFGTEQADQLTGDSMDNTIHGGSGDDVIVGGEGADQLYGGDGSDTFKISTANESGVGSENRDVIFDFDASLDQIDLTGLIGPNFSFVGTSEFSYDSPVSQVRFNAGSRLIEIDSDANAVADAEIEMADFDGSGLSFDDFIVG
jgi:hypothetical protein